LLQDSYANYVVQTSLDVAEPMQYHQLVDLIRPILPSIRHLPYCKRIQSKLMRDISGNMLHSPQQAMMSPQIQISQHQQQYFQQQQQQQVFTPVFI